MRAIVLGALAVLCLSCLSCRAPDYYEVTAGHSEGEITRGLGLDTERDMLFFSVGWFSGQTARAVDQVAMLDVSRSGELTMREEGSAPGVTVVGSGNSAEGTPVDRLVLAVAGLIAALAVGLGVLFKKLKG